MGTKYSPLHFLRVKSGLQGSTSDVFAPATGSGKHLNNEVLVAQISRMSRVS